MEKRNITDADVEAIAEAIRDKMIIQFYQDLGQGVWGWFRRIIVGAAFALAAYGAAKGYWGKHE